MPKGWGLPKSQQQKKVKWIVEHMKNMLSFKKDHRTFTHIRIATKLHYRLKVMFNLSNKSKRKRVSLNRFNHMPQFYPFVTCLPTKREIVVEIICKFAKSIERKKEFPHPPLHKFLGIAVCESNSSWTLHLLMKF